MIDMPEAGQAAVVRVKPTIKRTDSNYYSALVANSALDVTAYSPPVWFRTTARLMRAENETRLRPAFPIK